MYEYEARILKIYDGDSFLFLVSMGLNIYTETKTRLRGIDTPEIRGAEKVQGKEVKAYVEKLFEKSEKIIIVTHKTEKFGRWLVDVKIDGSDLKFLIENKFTHMDMREKRKWKHSYVEFTD